MDSTLALRVSPPKTRAGSNLDWCISLLRHNVFVFIDVGCLPGSWIVCHVLATAECVMQGGHGCINVGVQIGIGNFRLGHNPVVLDGLSL